MRPDSARRFQLEAAAAATDALLERSCRHYPQDLPLDHPSRIIGWTCRLRRIEGTLQKWTADEFARLSPLARQKEISRAHAEALLVGEQLGDVILSSAERERLVPRALGILPAGDAERFGEIWTCAELRAPRVVQSAGRLIDSLAAIESEYGFGTALAYVLFALAGVRRQTDMIIWGQRLDELFARLVAIPAARETLAAAGSTETGFSARFGLLSAVHHGIWQLWPRRLGQDFLLTHVVQRCLDDGAGAGNSLGLALLDSILLGRLGFPVQFWIDEAIVRLAVTVADRTVYWEPATNQPLSLVPVASGRLLDRRGLFGLVYGCIGTLCFQRGLYDRAAVGFERALELEPGRVELLDSLGSCWLRRGEPDRAIAILKLAEAEAPDSAEVQYRLGTARAMKSDWPQAIQHFRRAIELRPDYAEAYNNLGYALMRTGDIEQAESCYQAALRHRPEYWEACFNLGNLQLEAHNWSAAVRWYRETVRLAPKNAGAWYNLGQAYYLGGELDAAAAAYQKAVQIEPRHYGAWHNLGIVYRDKGQTEKAVQALERAVSINPNLMR